MEGHRAIGLIAASQLKGTNTEARISSLLGSLGLADIATCPDEVRDLEEYGTATSATCAGIFPEPPKGTANWHFIDTPIKDAPFEPTTTDLDAACGSACVLTQIKVFLAVLADAKPTDTAAQKLAEEQALSYVVHFIGDIHQPLHAAERNNDRGGNDERVSFFGTDVKGTLKLHTIWDKQIVSKIDSTQTKLASDLTREVAQAAAESVSTPGDWAVQSYDYARSVAYAGIPQPNGDKDVAKLGQPYQKLAAPVVRIQLARAGVRLAAALKTAMP